MTGPAASAGRNLVGMKLRPELAAFAAGLMINRGDDDPRWDIIAAQLHVSGLGAYSPADVKAAAEAWILTNYQDDISAPTVGEAVARMGRVS